MVTSLAMYLKHLSQFDHIVSIALAHSKPLDSHCARIFRISVSKNNFIEYLTFKSLRVVRFYLTIFQFLSAFCDLIAALRPGLG